MIHNGVFGILERQMRTAVAVVVMLIPAVGQAQGPTGTVRGKVTTADTQEPLPGVQVFVPGTTIGAVTGRDGEYVLRNLRPGAIQMKTRTIGFNPATQTANVGAGAELTVDFRLSRSALQLDQVVVTGTPGATEKRAVGNAIATVDASNIVPNSPAINLSALLNARAAGVTTLSQSGSVGAGSAIRIRGAGSISLSNAPLIYVDGVRLDNTSGSVLSSTTAGSSARIDDINPQDIASIEIIKGPAAATLYGTEASNGVIQIITKKGANGASSVTAELRTGVNYLPSAKSRFPLNWFINTSGVPVSQNLVETEAAAGRDIFRTGSLRQFDLQADGGNETAKYFLSGGYLSSDGIYTNNYLHRLTTRANVTANLSPVLSVQGTVGYLESKNPQMPEAASATFGIMPMLLFGSPASATTRLRGFLRATPEASETIRQVEDINRTTIGLSATYTPLAWLTSRVNTGLDWVRQNDNTLFPYDPNGFFGALSNGNKTVYDYTRKNTTLDWAATAKYSAPSETILASSVGLQYYDKTSSLVNGTSQNFPSPGLETLSSGSVTTSGETFVENKTLGGYVQEEFSSRNRRFVTLGLRGDANSAFGQTYKPAYYPKISGAWVVSEEGLPIPSWFSQLRLRGAYGLSGLQPDALAAVRTYTPVAGTGGAAAILPQGPGNRTIRPEKAKELELGFDADMFAGRAGIVFTYFNKKTTDAIVAVPSAPSTGFPGSEFRNLGKVTNTGYELELNTTPIARQRFSWDLGGTVTHVTNLVNSLGGSPTINTGNGFNTVWIKEGYPIGSFFAKKVVSADRTATNTATNALCDGGPDVDHAPVACATAPAVFLADPGPGWEIGLRSSLHLGSRLTLGGLVDGQLDTHMFSSMLFARDAAFRNSYDATHPAEESIIKIADISIGSNAPFVINNSFVKLRELSASYIVPQGLTRMLFGSRSATFGIAARNLGFLYRNPETKIVDPEGSVGQISWVHFEQALTPQLRSFVVTLRVTH